MKMLIAKEKKTRKIIKLLKQNKQKYTQKISYKVLLFAVSDT